MMEYLYTRTMHDISLKIDKTSIWQRFCLKCWKKAQNAHSGPLQLDQMVSYIIFEAKFGFPTLKLVCVGVLFMKFIKYDLFWNFLLIMPYSMTILKLEEMAFQRKVSKCGCARCQLFLILYKHFFSMGYILVQY